MSEALLDRQHVIPVFLSRSIKRNGHDVLCFVSGTKRSRVSPKPRHEPRMAKVLYGRRNKKKERWAPICETAEEAKHTIADLKFSSKPRLWKASELFREALLAQIPTSDLANTFL